MDGNPVHQLAEKPVVKTIEHKIDGKEPIPGEKQVFTKGTFQPALAGEKAPGYG